MGKKIIIIGIGETGDLAYEYFTHDSDFEVVAFSVEKAYIKEKEHLGKPVIELENLSKKYSPSEYYTFVALSSGRLNRDRTRLYELVKSKGYKFVSYVSSKAFVWHNVKIGENCFILENNVLQHKVEIGNNVVLWSGNHVGHQTKIRDNCFLTSHCVISGYCEIGENSFLGVNCTFANNIKIEKDCFVGAGSLVNKNLTENSLVKIDRAEKFKCGAREFCGVKEDMENL